jgi:hypothetical protein
MCLLKCLTIYLASTLSFQQLILLSKSHPRNIDMNLRSVGEAKNVNIYLRRRIYIIWLTATCATVATYRCISCEQEEVVCWRNILTANRRLCVECHSHLIILCKLRLYYKPHRKFELFPVSQNTKIICWSKASMTVFFFVNSRQQYSHRIYSSAGVVFCLEIAENISTLKLMKLGVNDSRGLPLKSA